MKSKLNKLQPRVTFTIDNRQGSEVKVFLLNQNGEIPNHLNTFIACWQSSILQVIPSLRSGNLNLTGIYAYVIYYFNLFGYKCSIRWPKKVFYGDYSSSEPVKSGRKRLRNKYHLNSNSQIIIDVNPNRIYVVTLIVEPSKKVPGSN